MMISIEGLPITQLTGVGPALAQKLVKLGLRTVQDVLFHLPYRYQDRTQITPIAALRADDYAVIEGEVVDVEIIQRRQKILQILLSDGTGTLPIKFFHFTAAQKDRYSQGGAFRFFGQVKGFAYTLSMVHPESINPNALSHQHMQESLTPIYPTTEGVSQKVLLQITEQALALIKKHPQTLAELLPEGWRQQYQLPSLVEALEIVHRPLPDADIGALLSGTHPAQQRLASEELLAHHASLRKLREQSKRFVAPSLYDKGELSSKLIASLPYQLTAAQQRVLNEIKQDIGKPYPMQRLVQGDVGSGKTIVAALAALTAIENGYQVAFMAPTELLAQQHFSSFTNWLSPLSVEVISLMSKTSAAQKRKHLERLKQNGPLVVVGTHALFQESVEFANLALAIIDEQHRFGVHQRLALRSKGLTHQLIMTATPIPRTLAMTAYADLDYSVIDELPPGRKAIETRVLSNTKREELIARISQVCDEGHQVYWVCPLIEESEVLQCQAAEICYQSLTEKLPQVRIGLVHGRLKANEKDEVMKNFKAHRLDILVATTVIEVGVDVPNASYMIIENAERLGLAQLHQLRGRVGRGAKQSYCLLMYQAPLSQLARLRLDTMRETQDGFQIAKKDLEIRGPGEILGTKQTGLMQFRVADLTRDQAWIARIQMLPPDWFLLHTEKVQAMIQRWIGEGTQYGEV
jgi:ATP-dependent DNA helicase RecG